MRSDEFKQSPNLKADYSIEPVLLSLGNSNEKEKRPVELKLVKYDELVKLLQEAKGKVVVVHFWKENSLAWKREFPRLVELQDDYGKELVAIAVNLDDPNDKGLRVKNEKLLQTKGATNITTLLLDETEDAWQKKLKITSLPTVFVFNPQGKYEVRYPEAKDDFDYSDIDKTIKALLMK
jgi:thiol-disulfide isomerase/thioredoxin